MAPTEQTWKKIKNAVLFSDTDPELGIDEAKNYCQKHGYTMEEVKILRNDNGVFVIKRS